MRSALGIALKIAECAGRWIRERGWVEPAGRSVDDTDVIDAGRDVGALIRGPSGPRSRHGAECHRIRAPAVSQNDAIDLPAAEQMVEAATALAPTLAGPER